VFIRASDMNEEIERSAMLIKWLRWNDPAQDKMFKNMINLIEKELDDNLCLLL